jgi:copper(I)-binding protein
MDIKASSTFPQLLLGLTVFFGMSHSALAVNLPTTQQKTTLVVSETVQNMAKNVVVSEQWARATFALAKAGAAYMTLQNKGDSQVQLVSASVDKSVAGVVELHHTKMADGMMQMQELSDGVLIAQNETVKFVPGGKHIMLMGLEGPLNAGEELNITLTFADGSQLSQVFPIKDGRKVSM